MNTRFCPSCGFSNSYTVTKPRICDGCKTDMDAAFASIITPAVATTPSRSLVPSKPPLSSVLSKRRRPIEDDEDEDDDIEGEETSYDEGEVQALAQEWSREIDASMFFTETKGGPIKLGDLSNVREAAEKMASEKPTRTRKSRK